MLLLEEDGWAGSVTSLSQALPNRSSRHASGQCELRARLDLEAICAQVSPAWQMNPVRKLQIILLFRHPF